MTRYRKKRKKGSFWARLLFVLLLAGAVYLLRQQLPSGSLLEPEPNLDTFPDYLAELYEKNPEARDFVLAWPDHQNSTEIGAITAEELSGGLPLFLQWDERWGYHPYGSAILGVTGCGPTCLSMVSAALIGDSAVTPAVVSDFSADCGYYVEGSGSSWELMTAGAERFGLRAQELPLSEELMAGALADGRPLIVSLGPGDFTDSGHFIVLSGYNSGSFSVRDPNSRTRSEKSWSYETLSPQILNIWAYSPAP